MLWRFLNYCYHVVWCLQKIHQSLANSLQRLEKNEQSDCNKYISVLRTIKVLMLQKLLLICLLPRVIQHQEQCKLPYNAMCNIRWMTSWSQMLKELTLTTTHKQWKLFSAHACSQTYPFFCYFFQVLEIQEKQNPFNLCCSFTVHIIMYHSISLDW